jgi:hypothetical protein
VYDNIEYKAKLSIELFLSNKRKIPEAVYLAILFTVIKVIVEHTDQLTFLNSALCRLSIQQLSVRAFVLFSVYLSPVQA